MITFYIIAVALAISMFTWALWEIRIRGGNE